MGGRLGTFYPFESLWSQRYEDAGDLPRSAATSRGQYHFVEADDVSTLYVSVPGYKRDDITIEMNHGNVSITGTPTHVGSIGVLVPKRINLKFAVHSDFLVDGAELKDGLLSVKLHRQRKTEAKKIPILGD